MRSAADAMAIISPHEFLWPPIGQHTDERKTQRTSATAFPLARRMVSSSTGSRPR
jgi:hypothetical protein